MKLGRIKKTDLLKVSNVHSVINFFNPIRKKAITKGIYQTHNKNNIKIDFS